MDEDAAVTDADRARRRYRVLQLRYHRRLVTEDIARTLGVTSRTVERDMAWWRTQWHAIYGTDNPAFDPLEVIGETVELYAQVEERALQELAQLSADTLTPAVKALQEAAVNPKATDAQRERALELMQAALGQQGMQRRASYQRMRCLKVAQEARQQRINFLQDLGLLDRNLGKLDLANVETADQVRRLLDHVRVTPTDLTSAAEVKQRKGAVH